MIKYERTIYQCEYTGTEFLTEEEAINNENACKSIIETYNSKNIELDNLIKSHLYIGKSILKKLKNHQKLHDSLINFVYSERKKVKYKGTIKIENPYNEFKARLNRVINSNFKKINNLKYIVNSGLHHRNIYVEEDNDFSLSQIRTHGGKIWIYKKHEFEDTNFSKMTLTSLRDMIYKLNCTNEFDRFEVKYRVVKQSPNFLYRLSKSVFDGGLNDDDMTFIELKEFIDSTIEYNNKNKINSRVSYIKHIDSKPLVNYLEVRYDEEIIILGV